VVITVVSSVLQSWVTLLSFLASYFNAAWMSDANLKLSTIITMNFFSVPKKGVSRNN
jgi:hypothetical protein